jgi:hypothetical protein
VASALANGIGGSGSSISTGAVVIAGGTLRFGDGALLAVTNTVAGHVTFQGGTLQAASIVNQGTLLVQSSINTLSTNLVNVGSLLASGGVLRVGVSALAHVTNAGTIHLAGGRIDAVTITNTGTIQGYGTITASLINYDLTVATNGQLNLQGYVSGTGPYRVAPSATLAFGGGGSISSAGLYNTNGTIRISGTTPLVNNNVFHNAGTLAMVGGIYQTSTKLTNALGGTIGGYGTIISAAELVNNGTLLISGGKLTLSGGLQNNSGAHVTGSGGELVVNGVFTNNGSLNFVGTAGTFNGAVFLSGGWGQNSTASSLFESNVMISATGTITDSGGTYIFRGNVNNQSTANTTWNTLSITPGTNTVGSGTKFLFEGTSLASTQYFTHPGLLLTGGFVGTPTPTTNGIQTVSSIAAVTGFENNFAVNQFWLTNTTLVLAPTGSSGALFVNDLYFFGSAHLIISNNMRVYFVNSNTWSLANITLLGNAEIHQLNSLAESVTVIPEPNVLLMWLAGAITLYAAKRRRSPLC